MITQYQPEIYTKHGKQFLSPELSKFHAQVQFNMEHFNEIEFTRSSLQRNAK